MWWYASNHQKYGPYSEAQLRELAQEGQIQRDDLVWHQGLDDWVMAASIEGLVPAHLLPPLPPTPVVDALPAQETTGISTPAPEKAGEPLLKAFVGQNYGFYASKWAEAERNNAAISWNWAAFFLGPLWMAYRKMYVYCAVFVAITFVTTSAGLLMRVPIATLESWYRFAGPAVSMLFGLFSNHLYKAHALRKINNTTAPDGAEQLASQIVRQGGASLLSVLAVVTATLVASLVMAMILAQFIELPKL
ncbi:MAG: GYF domain-containing protein [Brachymonas sp.]|nr:GYF domain-containing protein [Brachymonas sp.]